ncbi:competence protein [Fluviicola sp.]|uniref:competence protein n=1 Tax=Fluviicola sp. TaxID=1917219 RepID=UPI003D2DF23A
MAFEELKESTQQIQEETKAYVESTVQYYKLWGFQFVMKSTRMIVRFLLLGFFLMIALLFGSVAAALAIGNAIDSVALGFLIVAGAYFVLIILISFLRLKFVERRFVRGFSKLFFDN